MPKALAGAEPPALRPAAKAETSSELDPYLRTSDTVRELISDSHSELDKLQTCLVSLHTSSVHFCAGVK
jgi:hypothetical protein